MNDQLTKQLFDAHPKLYRGHEESVQTSLMGFGFECGDGWYQLLEILSTELDAHCAYWHVDVKAEQVKEKYGTLRFYATTTLGPEWSVDTIPYGRVTKALVRGLVNLLSRARCNVYDRFPGLMRVHGDLDTGKHRYYLARTDSATGRKLRGLTDEDMRLKVYDPVHKLIDRAEWLSYHTCERCGKLGTVQAPGRWVQRVCTTCLGQERKQP